MKEVQISKEEELLQKLKPEIIGIDKLLLDAKNPRFFVSQDKVSTINMSKEKVQNKALSNILDFDVERLKDSIENVGFLPIDRIVVVKLLEDSEFYVVIEGNRRIAAIKSLLDDVGEGKDLPENILNSLKNINVLNITDKTYDTSSHYQLLIQGLRHISGIKQWKPYQQAKALVSLVDELKYKITEAAEILGLGRNNASWMKKAFYAFEDMREDPEVELPNNDELVNYFSYFVEILKDSNLRKYYEWDDESNKFNNRNDLLNLYKWIGLYDPDEQRTKQIPAALDIRKLNIVLNNDKARELIESGANIHKAYSQIEIETKIEKKIDYSKEIIDICAKLERLPSKFIKNMKDEDKVALNKIIEIVREHLE